MMLRPIRLRCKHLHTELNPISNVKSGYLWGKKRNYVNHIDLRIPRVPLYLLFIEFLFIYVFICNSFMEIFTYYTIYPFQVCSSVILSRFRVVQSPLHSMWKCVFCFFILLPKNNTLCVLFSCFKDASSPCSLPRQLLTYFLSL